MLDYKLLEAFAAVVDEGGFEKGARVLALTQSAVSQRVKALEEEARQVLLVRSSPPEPTAAGRKMLSHYRKVKLLESDLGAEFGSTEEFPVLAVGLNEDSLSMWFHDAVGYFLKEREVLLDISVDDQAQTHRLLQKGEVLGCVSERSEPFQGCAVQYIGMMRYRLIATPEYKEKYYSQGVTQEALAKAPMLVFNRKDGMQDVFLSKCIKNYRPEYPAYYMPSTERFVDVVATGIACGMLPDEQSHEYLASGELVELVPGHQMEMSLYWHCWNIESKLLKDFSDELVANARKLLL
ncbi:MAG: LysR family transcriptional regulator ArgP [Desulfovibrio sp.]